MKYPEVVYRRTKALNPIPMDPNKKDQKSQPERVYTTKVVDERTGIVKRIRNG